MVILFIFGKNVLTWSQNTLPGLKCRYPCFFVLLMVKIFVTNRKCFDLDRCTRAPFSKMNIQKVIIKENVQEIEERSFQQCEESTQIEFDEDSQVKYIGDFAFKNCKKLNEITLPNSLETFHFKKVFSGTSLTSIQMSENNQKNDKFEIINNNVYLINEDERK